MNIQRFVNDLRKKITGRNYVSGWQNAPPRGNPEPPNQMTYTTTVFSDTNVGVIATPMDAQRLTDTVPERIDKKPVEVVKELLITAPVIDLLDLKKKIR